MADKELKAPWWCRVIPKWGGGLKEIAILGFVFGIYRLVSANLTHDEIPAFLNSYRILLFEKDLGLFVEQDFQSFFLGSELLTQLVNIIYTIFYYPALILFGIWAYKCHREQYTVVRNVFIVSAGIAFLCFTVYPVAPPRLLPYPGFVDTMAQFGFIDYKTSGLSSVTNPFAAMPSLHFGWTLLIGSATVYLARSWWGKTLGIILPVGMLMAIIATANHFFLDAIGGALVIGLAYLLVLLFSRLKERNAFPRPFSIFNGTFRDNGVRMQASTNRPENTAEKSGD